MFTSSFIHGVLDIERCETMHNVGIDESFGHNTARAKSPSKPKDNFPRVVLHILAWCFNESSRVKYRRVRVHGGVPCHGPIHENRGLLKK